MKKEGKNMNYANQFGYSDVSPCEVVKVISEKTMEIRYMDTEALPWKREFHPGGFFGNTSNQNEQKWNGRYEEDKILRERWFPHFLSNGFPSIVVFFIRFEDVTFLLSSSGSHQLKESVDLSKLRHSHVHVVI